MPELKLDRRTVSAGGTLRAATWPFGTVIIGPRYAPDIKIVGVDAIALAANLNRIFVLSPTVEKSTNRHLLSYN